MNVVVLSRIQFGLTVGFHFIFVPITIGLSWLLVWMMTKYKNTGDRLYHDMTRFWVRIFGVTAVIGIATGVTMEFQFGTNWAQYSRFVGDIFGAPLAAEAILAFFLESTFLAVMLLGWERVSVRALWFASWMIAIGATLSAFWILVANSWQQTPAGYKIIDGRAQLTDPLAAVFNASTWPRFFHTVDGAIITGAFFMLGLSAIFLLKNRHIEFARESFKIALIAAFLASAAQLPLGHFHAVQVAGTQPIKLAAYEGIFETQKRAPMLLFGIPDSQAETMKYALRIPGLLSLLASGNVDTEIKGLKDFPKDEWPPLGLTFYPFHFMVVLGMYFIGIAVIGLLLLWQGKVYTNRYFLIAAIATLPLPFIANELGWMATEIGRQPWAVYKLLRTSDAISVTVPAGQILFSLITVSLIYTLLFAAWVFILRREIEHGPGETSHTSEEARK